MKTPEQVAAEALVEDAGAPESPNEVYSNTFIGVQKLIAKGIEADRAQRSAPDTPDTHCFREESPTERCEACGWLAGAHTGCDCEDTE